MSKLLKIAIWNANGLSQHAQEMKAFINEHKLDIILVSETHFTNRSYFNIRNYTIYDTKHPDGTAHGGTAIIIKNNIKHYELQKFQKEHIQATSVVVEDWIGSLTISALYSPPKHSITKAQYLEYFKTLGTRFIAGGDYNAKHTHWGSRTITYKGRQLLNAMQEYKLGHISTGQPTYWPTDRRKIPDLIDFCVTKGVTEKHFKAQSCLDLSSDHSPVLITASTSIINKTVKQRLHTKKTNWDLFRTILDENIALNIPLKNEVNISNAITNFNTSIITAVTYATPTQTIPQYQEEICPIAVKSKIEQKRKLRKKWQNTRAPADKSKLNRAVKEIKIMLNKIKNEAVREYVAQLTPTENTDYSLWKATKKIKQPQTHMPPIKMENGEWARTDKEKALTFAEHLQSTFLPYPCEITNAENDEIIKFLDSPIPMDVPITNFSIREVHSAINKEINQKKAPGYDQISGKMVKELSEKGKRFITYLMNALLRTCCFPKQWKMAQIILIPKPGKDINYAASYRPISLLPVMAKLFEKLLTKRLRPIIIARDLIPAHQFGFRQKHGTTEQVHRIINQINKDLEGKRYCSAAFLDITQAFDKVWHEGLLYKIKHNLPYHFYHILREYLADRDFMVKIGEESTTSRSIKSGVPQGSVLGPVLYLLYTADLPTSADTLVATFADDTAILSSSTNAELASRGLQKGLNKIQIWLKRWRIKANETKSVHVTFTNRKGNCPPVTLNNISLPQEETAKYLGLHLDRRLTWRKHIQMKSKQLRTKYSKMYWLMGRSSQLSLESKLMLYKAILMPIWTYGIELWGTSSNSNIEIIERFQSKVLREIVNAPWYVRNAVIRNDLNMCSVKERITSASKRYQERLEQHPNQLANSLLYSRDVRRLKRYQPLDLQRRFSI